MRSKYLTVMAALMLVASLLAACGETATPTTVPAAPTATTAAAAGATDTTAPAGATSTTAAPAEATPTTAASTGNKPKVVVSSKNFTEELIVGEMYALMLEQAGIPVERKLNLGATDIAQAALVKGDISLYPEYTGTGLLVVLGYTGTTITDPQKVYSMVQDGYKKFNLTWLDQSPMNDSQGLATTQAIADKYGLKTLSDLSTKANNLILAATPEFQDRPDGLPGLQKTYGGFNFKDVQVFDIGLKYQALLDGKADVAVAFTTDGQIAGDKLVVLQDDKNLWPPYNIAPVVRNDILADYPQIKDVLNGLAPKITSEEIAALNWQVDGQKQDYAQVAKDWLTKQGLLKSGSAPAATTAPTTAPAAATPTTGSTSSTGGNGSKPTVVVSSKNFTEELLVGEMYALMLEKAGIPVQRKLNLGATDIAQAALVKGDISLYPEYTGTGLLVVLGYTGTTVTDPQKVYSMVQDGYKPFNLTWLDQSPMNDSQGLATTKAIADKYGIKTLSDLSTKANNLILAATPEFQDRPDGLPGLQKTYGGFNFKDVQVFDIGLKYQALLDGKADVAVAFTTDGQIAGDNLVVIQDDKNLWPPYHIAPVVRNDILAAYPQIKDVLNGLAPKITSEEIAALNWAVDGQKQDYAQVAKDWLTKQGLLK